MATDDFNGYVSSVLGFSPPCAGTKTRLTHPWESSSMEDTIVSNPGSAGLDNRYLKWDEKYWNRFYGNWFKPRRFCSSA